ncbi:MAG: type II toxin-antitoxin system VapC family toxin [Candidatus Aenigmarchaeota archaeon]|nr:type II toxin-antitoxin system VapC family toxin [Candidatus Aenigmarchaeota archaeon]
MAREKKIVDASVLAKCFLKEDDSGKAIALVEGHLSGQYVLIVPELIFFEVLNAIKYQLKPTEEELVEAAKALSEFQLHVEHAGEFILSKLSRIAITCNLTAYDATYVALGQLHSAEVLTADKKLVKTGLPFVKQF